MHDRSQSLTPPMLVCKYMDENGLVAMLATKRSAGVAPEVNLRISLCAGDKAHKRNHTGFETQGICHEKSKIGVSVAPQKGLMSSKKILKIHYIPNPIHTFTCNS